MKPRTSPAPERTAAPDTIVAIATPVGESAVGVVRLSGVDAIPVAALVVRTSTPLAAFPSHTLHRVTIVDPDGGEALDDALCTVMRAPRSYTGEDVVEISCHGSPALLRTIVERLRARGARIAEPGEFTRRAFLNGRLDLARAEAVALLISARTERAVKLAARTLTGGLSERLERLRDAALSVVAGLEVTLDFPEDGVGLATEAAVRVVGGLEADVTRWTAMARQGRVVHEGITVAIVGAPNAGKSSLLNALLGQDRAIVSPTPGTTRDVVEGTIALGGVPVRFLDTAGLGEAADAVEAEGMRRSLKAAEESDVLLVVFDGSVAPDATNFARTENQPRLFVRSKSDLRPHPRASEIPGAIDVSALTGAGLDELLGRLGAVVAERACVHGDEGGLVASLRQMELLAELQKALAAARAALGAAPLETALIDLRAALNCAASMLGIEVGDAVLDRIFSTFCLGK